MDSKKAVVIEQKQKKDKFLESVLLQINVIDKLYADSGNSTKAYAKGPELIKVNQKIKTDQDKIEALNKLNLKAQSDQLKAEAAVAKLLNTYESDPEKCKLIQQIIQDIQKRHGVITKDTPRLINYPKHLDEKSWGNFYVHSRYENLMPYCQLAYLEEKKGNPEEHALKLSLIFDTERDALSYIRESYKNNTPGVHNSCVFTLHNPQLCDFKSWKALIKANIHDKAFRILLQDAPNLEKEIKNNKLKSSEKINREAIKSKKSEIAKAVVKFKSLKTKHGNLQPEEEKEYKEIIQHLGKLRLELFKLSAGIFLDNSDIPTLKSAKESYLSRVSSYQIFQKNGLTENDYEKFKKLKPANDDVQIPNITIKGETLGYPGITLTKTNVINENERAEAACYGKLTRCCQSLSGEAGEPCVIYGIENPNSGFYNIKNDKGELLAQAWAWRSQTGALVLDSVEISGHEHINTVVSFFNKLTEKMVNEHAIPKVACGSSSGISRHFGEESVIARERFIDYDGYCDSIQQRVIIDASRPYIYDSKGRHIDDEKVKDFVEKILQNSKADQNISLIEMINWAILKPDEKLLDDLKNILLNHRESKKVGEMIQIMSSYLEDSEQAKILLNKMDEFPYLKNVIDKNGNTTLMVAIQHGLSLSAIKLIEQGEVINDKNNLSKTPLICAIEQNLNEVAFELINKNAKIDEKDGRNATALMHAIEKGNSEIALFLIKKGAKINEKDDFGKTALMYAIEKGLNEVAFKLIKKQNIKINEKDSQGHTALTHAVLSQNINIIDKLVERGAKLNLKDNCDVTAFSFAELMGFNKVADRLKELGAKAELHPNYNKKDQQGYTPLMAALVQDRLDLAFKLMDIGVDIHAKDNYGRSAILFAVQGGNTKIVLKLLDNGANIHEVDNNKDNLLKQAVIGCHLDLVSKLVEKGLNIDVKDDFGNTALMTAISYAQFSDNTVPYKDMIVKLIELGANVDEKNSWGRTALMEAEFDPTLLSLIQTKVAERNQKVLQSNPKQFTPLNANFEEKFKSLIKNDEGEKLIVLLKEKNYAMDKLCIIDEDENQCSLLMHACELGKTKVVKALLEAGANVNKQDKDGDTALAYAVDCEEDSQKEVIRLLLNSGANSKLTNKENETAIDRAKEYHDNHDIVKLLESPITVVPLNRGRG